MSRYGLPSQTASFVGRNHEIAEINARLNEAQCRLLTLVGPGGIGKTRLAIQAATYHAANFTHGICFVPLQSVSKPEHIVSVMADALKFQFYEGGDPKQQLLGYLREKHILLILDNFDHLLQGVDLLINILSSAPQVKLLVTSREVLNLRQEWRYAIKGMSYPEGNNTSSIGDYDAVRLFFERARQIRSDFSEEVEYTDVVRITRLVEGMPLAIELAATWLKLLSCKAIGDEIQHNLQFLMTTLRDIPERHRSMHVVFERSWQTLTPQERTVFMKLSVFRGGFTRNAAESVTGASLAILSSLVDKSFIRRTTSDRYEIHELLRQYGDERLKISGNVQAARNAHSDYYLATLEQCEMRLKGYGQLETLKQIETDLENIRTAWEHAVDRQNNLMINRATESLFWFCVSRYRLQEGMESFQKALDTSSAFTKQTLGRLLTRQIYLQVLGHIAVEDNWERLEKSLEIAKQNNDSAEAALCIMSMGDAMHMMDRFVMAIQHYEQALKLYRRLDDSYYMVRTLERIGHCGISLGRFEDSREALHTALGLARHAGDRIGTAHCLSALSAVAGFSGDYITYDTARREALAIQREMGDRAGQTYNLSALAIGTLFRGDFAETTTLAEEAFEIATEINHIDSKSLALIILGLIAVIQEDYAGGRKLLEEGRRIATGWFNVTCSEVGLAMVACGEGNYNHARVQIQSIIDRHSVWAKHKLSPRLLHLIPIVYALILIDEGSAIPGIEILSSALHFHSGVGNILKKWAFFSRLQTNLKSDLGDEVYTAAWERGESQDLGEILADLLDKFASSQNVSGDSISPQMKIANQMLPEPLTSREHEILVFIARGLYNRQIAEQLSIEISTVKRHISNCYGKLGVSSRTQAIRKAQQMNLL
jgi:predicted ATPase/DNA-binding CsgD family transcriptional regulator